MLMKGDRPIKIRDFKPKLSAIWGVEESTLHITPMGKGIYTLNLKSDKLKSRVFACVTLHLRLGVF